MRHARFLAAAVGAIGMVWMTACSGNSAPDPPRAKRVPHRLEAHGDVRTDDYYWLNRRDDPEVLAYLEAENAYTEARMKPTAQLRETLYEEIVGRIRQDDSTVPAREGRFEYYTRYEEGKEYPIHCRRRVAEGSGEEILLDVNDLAMGHEFYRVGQFEVSPGGNLLAFAEDTLGRRIYTLRFKDLVTGELLPDVIPEATATLAWATDDRTLFYARQDPVTLRSFRILRHELGSDPAGDPVVFEETDDTFSCYVRRTRSNRFLLIASVQTLSTEYRFLDAGDPRGAFRVIEPRRRDHEYEVVDGSDRFYIRTNLAASNFRLVRAPVGNPGLEHWEEVVPHRDDVLLESVEAFRDHLVLTERRDGLTRLRVLERNGGGHEIAFDEPAYVTWVDDNREFDTAVVRFGYSSMTTPKSIFDYDMETRQKVLRKRDEVLGGFDPANYRTERVWATARDGRRVPISLVYRLPFEPDGSRPLLLYGYGSYGYSVDPAFQSERLSLLDRGFVWAIAHVRGGEELGRQWYEDGKLLHKKNTFHDFIDCAEHLVREGYADRDRLYALGGSAGGMLVGVVLNLRPDLFHGAVAAVPFVDVVTTMLDEDIPLTTGEYDEWGDPRIAEYYDYMLSYSPYDQVRPVEYPHLLVTTGLHDSQVQYWEPAKWVARLRAMGTGDRLLLLKTEMDAGHGGVSGRYRGYRETAFRYAFLIDLAENAG